MLFNEFVKISYLQLSLHEEQVITSSQSALLLTNVLQQISQILFSAITM